MECNSTGNGTGEENIKKEACDYELFKIMPDYAKIKHNYHPQLLFCNRPEVVTTYISDSLDDVVETSAPLDDVPIAGEYANKNMSNTPINRSEEDINMLLLKKVKTNNRQFTSLMTEFGQNVQNDYSNIDDTAMLNADRLIRQIKNKTNNLFI